MFTYGVPAALWNIAKYQQRIMLCKFFYSDPVINADVVVLIDAFHLDINRRFILIQVMSSPDVQ